MANPRSKFEMIAEYLCRSHDGVSRAEIYRRPGLKHRTEPFCLYFNDGLAFRLHGRSLVSALALPDVRPFDPLNPDKPPPGWPGWVWAPPSQMLRWDRLCTEALRCLRTADEGARVSWNLPEPPAIPEEPVPPPSLPESLADRVKKFLGGSSWSKWLD
jgi:hypothetical protein